jgi:hypothetical protein
MNLWQTEEHLNHIAGMRRNILKNGQDLQSRLEQAQKIKISSIVNLA